MLAITNSWFSALIITLGAPLLLLGPSMAIAHPMPDTEIKVEYHEDRLDLTIHVSLADLMLAIPDALSRDDESLTDAQQNVLRSYFGEHTQIFTESGNAVPVSIEQVRLVREQDAEVGRYEEVEVAVSAVVVPGQSLSLHYDGVLHQVANHRAIVYGSDGEPVGIIRFDLSDKRATPVVLLVP